MIRDAMERLRKRLSQPPRMTAAQVQAAQATMNRKASEQMALHRTAAAAEQMALQRAINRTIAEQMADLQRESMVKEAERLASLSPTIPTLTEKAGIATTGLTRRTAEQSAPRKRKESEVSVTLTMTQKERRDLAYTLREAARNGGGPMAPWRNLAAEAIESADLIVFEDR